MDTMRAAPGREAAAGPGAADRPEGSALPAPRRRSLVGGVWSTVNLLRLVFLAIVLGAWQLTGAITSLLTMAFLAMVLYGIVGAIERRVCHWQISAGSTATVSS